MNRRGFFGAVAACSVAPLVPVDEAPLMLASELQPTFNAISSAVWELRKRDDDTVEFRFRIRKAVAW